MKITSIWEFKCLFLPELAHKEYIESLSPSEQAKLAAEESIRMLLRGKQGGLI